MNQLQASLLRLPRLAKRVVAVALDAGLTGLALWFAFVVRLGFDDMGTPVSDHSVIFLSAPLIMVGVFQALGIYKIVARYFAYDELVRLLKAVSLSALFLGLLIYWVGNHKGIFPRSIIFNYWWISLVLISGSRLLVKRFFFGGSLGAQFLNVIEKSSTEGLARVAIYGAGSAGNQLVSSLRHGRVLRPVAFIDDDPTLASRVIAGIPVFSRENIGEMILSLDVSEILLAIPSATRARRKEILALLEAFPLHVRSVPGIADLVSGRVSVDEIREVEIADLLGRDAVPANPDLLSRCIQGQCVMVTGAGGSIGSELCRQIFDLKPALLVLFDHSEFNLYTISQELKSIPSPESESVQVVSILGSVTNFNKLNEVMARWSVNTVYHAAAYKHVPIVEQNVAEGIVNNVLGTLYLAQAAIQAGVSNFVLISTDKAVRPTNVMGSTKRLAEMVLQSLSKERSIYPFCEEKIESPQYLNNTRFTMVRFGNVLGSSGSVIPLFHQQIKAGGPVTVTHPNITRYFMTIPEAAQLVIQAGSMGQGGDVYVLDMGQPVKIVDLAEKMVHLSGFTVRTPDNLGGDIEIQFTGLRPGEKLYEELLIGGDVKETSHPMIMAADEEFLSWDLLKDKVSALLECLQGGDQVAVRKLLKDVVAGYEPESDIVDLAFRRQCAIAERKAN
ncbi:polysaccharide biosynthesis protein [Pseudomonas sp. NPDC007930]|uniref:polysaccharide biosynthesis protein n=1 Tax=Pseudomonas sp. NPDC007930 TaxID=3364417 RepID=UPI0036E70950